MQPILNRSEKQKESQSLYQKQPCDIVTVAVGRLFYNVLSFVSKVYS